MTETESVEMENSNISESNRNLRNEKFYLVPICIGACFVIALAIAIIIWLLTTKTYHDNTEKGQNYFGDEKTTISDQLVENIRYKTYPVPVSNTIASWYDETIYNSSRPHLFREIDNNCKIGSRRF